MVARVCAFRWALPGKCARESPGDCVKLQILAQEVTGGA